ncbi:MAG: SH3 domain-containing protein [Acetobacteraceae bacterium]|nr:SH3 domain-containing protein [Acetobacteraceae bacterium]
MALGANIRAAPDGSAPVLGTIPAGARVLILARIGGWLQIGAEDRALGWVHVSRAVRSDGGGD